MNLLILVACFLTAFILRATVNWIDLIPWRKSVAAHWTERSRILWPVRNTDRFLGVCLPLLLATWSTFLCTASTPQLLMRWAAAAVGACGASWYLARQLRPEIHFHNWLHGVFFTCFLRFGIWIVFVFASTTMPKDFNLRTWITLGGMALLQVVWPTLALLLLRLLGTLKPPSARLREIVAGCERNNRPLVKNLWQARGIAANAYALPLSGTLVFYDRLLEVLNDDEVAAICHHELEHLAESNWIILGRYLGAFAILPVLLVLPISHRWEFLGVIGILMLMIVWAQLAKKLIYQMEIRADATASNQQAEQGVYARTLETLYRESQLPAVTPGKHSTHPHLYDRMLAAGITPEYPRPRAPQKFTVLGWLVLIGCFIGYAAALLTTSP